MSQFDFNVASWTVRRNGDLWSVIEQAGSEHTRYWFGPMRQDEIEPFIADRKAHFARIASRHLKNNITTADYHSAEQATGL